MSGVEHRRRRVILIAFLAGAACTPWILLAVTYGLETIAVDRCLDAGGSFDYSRMVCDDSRNHPYVPFAERHGSFVRSMLYGGAVAILGGAVFVGLTRNSRSVS